MTGLFNMLIEHRWVRSGRMATTSKMSSIAIWGAIAPPSYPPDSPRDHTQAADFGAGLPRSMCKISRQNAPDLSEFFTTRFNPEILFLIFQLFNELAYLLLLILFDFCLRLRMAFVGFGLQTRAAHGKKQFAQLFSL